jgi:hypothetical protein
MRKPDNAGADNSEIEFLLLAHHYPSAIALWRVPVFKLRRCDRNV